MEYNKSFGQRFSRVPVTGGPTERLVWFQNESVQWLALTSKSVIFTLAPREPNANASIASIPLNGGEMTPLVNAAGAVNALVADEHNAYFIDAEGVKSVSVSGGTTRTVAKTTTGVTLALAKKTLYFSDEGGIYTVSIDGGKATSIVASTGQVRIFSCGPGICWLGGSALMGTLMQLVPGGMPSSLNNGIYEPFGIVFDGAEFFVAQGHGALTRVPSDGGASTTVYVEPGINDLVIQGECLYWSSVSTISSVAVSSFAGK